MSRPDAEARARNATGQDSGQRARQIAALMLRLAIGISLLNAGVARHLGLKMTNQGPGMVRLDASHQILSALAYAQIGLGIALMVGFLITATATLASIHLLLLPFYQMAMEVTAGSYGSASTDPYIVATTQMLPLLIVPYAMLIWFSSVNYHPLSVDALIFARTVQTRAIRPPSVVILDDPAPAPGASRPGQSSGG